MKFAALLRKPLAVCAAAVLATLAGTASAIEFRSSDTHNANDYPTVVAVRFMSEQLEKASGGKHKIKVFNKAALGSEKETIDQVKIGALDFTRVNVGPMNGVCPMTQVPTMPFLFRSVEHMRKALDGPVGEEILKSCESAGFVGLAFYDSGARSIYAKKPIRTVADAKGLKIRVQQSDLWVAVAGAMGANPTPMPAGEVLTALRTGLVDAAENNYPSYGSGFRHFEVAKFYNKTEHSMAPEVLLFSKIVWDKLPKADQDMIRAAAKASVPFNRQAWAAYEKKEFDMVKAAGTEIIEVDKKSFQDVMVPVYDKFANTPDLKRMVKAVQDTKQGPRAPAHRRGALTIAPNPTGARYVHPLLCHPVQDQPHAGRGGPDRADRLRAVPGDWPLCVQRHAHLGRGTGVAPGALHHLPWRGCWRARRRPHRHGLHHQPAARAAAAQARNLDPCAGRNLWRADGLQRLHLDGPQMERPQTHAACALGHGLLSAGDCGCAGGAFYD
jgi:tripartite ATP-independent transporter DctP family solute receptor